MDLGLSYSRDLYKDERYGAELSAGVTGKWIQERPRYGKRHGLTREIWDFSFRRASNGGKL